MFTQSQSADELQSGGAAGRPYPAVHAAAAGPAGPPPVLMCEGIEVTQVVQNMAHDVPLVAGKATVVRVYLSVEGAEILEVRGALNARAPAGQGVWVPVASLGTVTIDPVLAGDLRKKREELGNSLNFLLPAEVTNGGACEVALGALEQADGSQALAVPAGAARTVDFVESPPLRLHVVGIRYQDAAAGSPYEPRPLDFALIRAWLQRAYPVAEVQWTQITMDGPKQWPFQAAEINAFLRGLRQVDLLSGLDRRTHYFGLVFDGGRGYFMRGLASGIPSAADPSTVASGPTGAADFGWDADGAYGDWYTAHELGHTFGRYHAEFCGAGGGAPYPYQNGQLSDDDGEWVGLDVGAAERGLPMRALPGAEWHDLMTYCDHQWLSGFTYEGLRQRLLDEDSLPAGPAGAAAAGGGLISMTPGGIIHVVATVNLTASAGRLQHVTAYPEASLEPEAGETGPGAGGAAPAAFSLRLSSSAGDLIDEYPARVIPDACLDPGDDETGIIDATIPNDMAAARLDLLLDGQVLDTFSSSVPAMPAADIRVLDAGPAGLVGGGARAKSPTLAWTDPGMELPGLVALPGQTPTYAVELSVDGGATWRTAGFGLAQPQVTVDPALLAGAETVQVKVTTTDGFTSESSVTTLKVTDLM
jgi:hypothetical protein